MDANETYEELSRQSLVGHSVAINNAGRAYLRASANAERASGARQTFQENHGTVGNVTLLKIVEYGTFVFGICCIYVIDVLLFGASAQYVASLLGSESALLTTLAKFVVPASFLGIEVLIALQIEKSRQDARFAFGSAFARRGWIGLGVLVALVMPLAAKATAESASVVAGSDTPVLMLAVLGIVSFSAHVLVLFGGRLAQEAKTYFAFASARKLHDARANASAREAASAIASLNSLFIAYVHAWRAHNTRFAVHPSGPFDQDVVALLRRQFPYVATGDAATVFPPEEEERT